MNKNILIVILALISARLNAQDAVPSDLEEVNVYESLKKSGDVPADTKAAGSDVKMSTLEEQDDLQSLKEDIGDVVFEKDKKKDAKKENGKENAKEAGPLNAQSPAGQNVENKPDEKAEIIADKSVNFDTGNEEKKLLELSKYVDKKITPKEWDDIAVKAKLEKYEVQKGDYLWKIAKQLFGSGFYYSKIWSLNPQITNPHEIEPGTILSFDTGTADTMPNVQVGEFDEDEYIPTKGGSAYTGVSEKDRPSWLQERKKLIDQGVYFQFASEETYEDLERLEKQSKNTEYEK